MLSMPNTARYSLRCAPFDRSTDLLLHGLQRGSEALLLAVVAGPVPEGGTSDAGRNVLADQLAVLILTLDVVEHDVLRDDHVAFHAQHLGDVSDAARAVAQAS